MAQARNEYGFENLDGSARLLTSLLLAQRTAVYAVALLLMLASWMLLLAMAQKLGPASGPGAGLLEGLPDLGLPAVFDRFLALCLRPAGIGVSGPTTFLMLTIMWFLMSMAMMLPSAAPLIRTYCEIADTAYAAAKQVAHPLWLVAGYLAVWLFAASLFAGVGMATGVLGQPGTGLWPVAGPVAAAALAFAGLYQFSGLKEACLVKCRNPFSTLFANWTSRPNGVFRLGLHQGLWCLGCCWALMLVMFAVGIMNVFWMALLAMFTLVEKNGRGAVLSRCAGAILLVWAAAVLLVSL